MLRIIRDKAEINSFANKLAQRGSQDNSDISRTVVEIIRDVSKRGDEAVKEFTAKYDCENAQYYRVPDEVIDEAFKTAELEFISALECCKVNIEAFHVRQKREGFTIEEPGGAVLKQRVSGLDKVGIYVPGGTAAYPSSVLMNAIPAKLAGVGEIIMVTPPRNDGSPNPYILAAARLCGVDKIFLCGGAQAVAALAYGTKEIPKVAKIVGPGNAYVAAAKKMLYGIVDIDMIAGPSEILIIADENATPRYIAADLLSQAEHDKLASAVLVTTSEEIAQAVCRELDIQLEKTERKEIAGESLKNYGAALIAGDMEEAVKIANAIAPEHCEVHTTNPFELEEQLVNAGSLFLGEYSPEPLGDYFAGPNHVLPTNGTARFFSPLGTNSFEKKSSVIYYNKISLEMAADDIMLIAKREGLGAHANAIKVRMSD